MSAPASSSTSPAAPPVTWYRTGRTIRGAADEQIPFPSALEFVMSKDWCGRTYLSIPQRALVRAIYGTVNCGPWPEDELAAALLYTGRKFLDPAGYAEVVVRCGIRSGKDSIFSCLILYEMLFMGHDLAVQPGETPYAAIVAQDWIQSRAVALRLIKDLAKVSKLIKSQIKPKGIQRDYVALLNGAIIRAWPSTEASLVGYSVAVAALNEMSRWPQGAAANSDREIYRITVGRGMGFTRSTPKRFIYSSPMGPSGLFFDLSDPWGRQEPNDPRLIFVAPTEAMNPSISKAKLEAEAKRDPLGFRMDYMAEFGDDEAAFLAFQDIERARVPGRTQDLPPRSSTVYAGGVDSSGGTGRDNFTFCICHREVTPDGNVFVVMDLLRVWNRHGYHFDLNAVCDEIVMLCRRYGIDTVYGDNYAGGLAQDQIRLRGIKYDLPHQTTKVLHGAAPVSWREGPTLHRSELYLKLLPFFTLGNIEIHDDPALLRELQMLERNAGTDKIDHPTGLRDDRCSALATAVCMLVLNDDRPTPGVRSVQGSSLTQALGYPNPIAPARLVRRQRVMKVKKLVDVPVEGDLCECGHYHHRAPDGIACAVFCAWCREKRPPVPLGLRPTEKKEVEVEEREHDSTQATKIELAGHPASPARKNKLPTPMGGFVRGSGMSRW